MKRLALTLVVFVIMLVILFQLPGYAVLVMPVGNLEIHLGVAAWILLLGFWLVWWVTRWLCRLRTV